jgi:LmbE family N-acetylglucosaminyl deacetylase
MENLATSAAPAVAGAPDSKLSAIFIGSHADDIEIACAGTLAKLSAAGWETWVCVLTDEKDPLIAQSRRSEAVQGAGCCGVPAERVLFLGAPDTQLACNGENVGALRRLLGSSGCNPDLVFAHARCDSHGDHRAAHELVLSTFRKKPILCFAVVNSLVSSDFHPHVFVDVSDHVGAKIEALSRHRSQSARIDVASINQLGRRFAAPDDVRQMEPFELILQEGAEELEYLAHSLNDDAFHGFWFPLIHYQGIKNLYSEPVHRTSPPRWRRSLEREGYGELVQAFVRRWKDDHPISEMPATSGEAESALRNLNCILSGGAASNGLTACVFNGQETLRYVTAWEGEDRKRAAPLCGIRGRGCRDSAGGLRHPDRSTPSEEQPAAADRLHGHPRLWYLRVLQGVVRSAPAGRTAHPEGFSDPSALRCAQQ